MATWIVRPVQIHEFEAWARLFRGYVEFYERVPSDSHEQQVWGWIHQTKVIEALVAVEVNDVGIETSEPKGLAHIREWVRPLRGTVCGYLDDLFVDPATRGTGVAEALFAALEQIGVAREWPVIRWTTADNNYRARSVYDRLATRTPWITYDMDIPVVHRDQFDGAG